MERAGTCREMCGLVCTVQLILVKWETEAHSYLLAYSHWHIELCLLSFLPQSLLLHIPLSLLWLLFSPLFLCLLIMFLSSCSSFRLRLSNFSTIPFLSWPFILPHHSTALTPKNKSCIPEVKENYTPPSFILSFFFFFAEKSRLWTCRGKGGDLVVMCHNGWLSGWRGSCRGQQSDMNMT